MDLLSKIKLSGRFGAKFHNYQRKTFGELSGGEARIAEIYLVLMSDAEFCILDEPFSNISPNWIRPEPFLHANSAMRCATSTQGP